MSQNFHASINKGYNPPPAKTYCTTIQITPTIEPHRKASATNASQNGSFHDTPEARLPRKTSDTLLVATVDGKAVGGGPGVLYSSINGNAPIGSNLQAQNGGKVNPSDPQVRKLVYNMYRGLLSTKHDRANHILQTAPQENVTMDEGVGERISSMMRHQTEKQKESKMMNLGPPPPPPPPPFSTGAPAPIPKQPAEVPSKAPPPVAVPAALAGAMLKEKKPFTYTPGGLNLAEINGQTQPEQNGAPFMVQQAGFQDPMQSRAFRVLQNVYDPQEVTGNQVQDCAPEPKKYMGSHIPSRSFKILQAMTDDDDTNSTCSEEKLRHHESSALEEGDNLSSKYNNNPLSTLSRSSLSPITPSSSSASITSADKSYDIGSRVAPSYTSTKDSHVYRQVAPKVMSNPETDRIVNSALSVRRESSPRPWQKESLPIIKPLNNYSEQRTNPSAGLESPPRLLNIIKQESSDSGNQLNDTKLLYGGSSIPSKVFRQLQSDYSSSNSGTESPVSNSSTSSSNRVTEIHIPRLMQQLHVDQRHPSAESINSLEDQYGVLETATVKESVLKELTSQFDPQTRLKKPGAAPGRVFKYLQQHYDDPQDSDFISSSSNSLSNTTSPSNALFSSDSSGIDSGQCDSEPKPYSGCRIPGRTFKLLQENMETHPTVLQARK